MTESNNPQNRRVMRPEEIREIASSMMEYASLLGKEFAKKNPPRQNVSPRKDFPDISGVLMDELVLSLEATFGNPNTTNQDNNEPKESK